MGHLLRKSVLLFAIASVFAISGCAGLKSPDGLTTTIILVRHADRNVGAKNLNDRGNIRAAALPAALTDIPVDAIYSPDKKRNIDTGKPLAKQRGIDVTVIPISSVAKRLMNENPGKSALWIGNTTNLPQIYRELGGEGEPPNNYGDLYIMKIDDAGKATVEKRHFGPK
jgi:histidine phosphatase superfamily protein (branch 1)